MIHTPIVESLKAWRDAMESDEVVQAIEYHDAVTAHIIEHKDSAVLFKAAGFSPTVFVEWAATKKTLKEQFAKSFDELHDEFKEGLEQLEDLLVKFRSAESSREVIRWAQEAHKSIQAILLNSSHLDMEPSVDDIAEQLLASEKGPSGSAAPEKTPEEQRREKGPKKARQRAKPPRKAVKKAVDAAEKS